MKNNRDDDNVIDLCERREAIRPEEETMQSEKMKNLKMRIDLHNAKLMVSTSLLSVIILATVANTSTLTTKSSTPDSDQASQRRSLSDSRAIASVQTGTSAWEDRVAQKLSERTLTEQSQVGRKPSSLDQLTFGALEGKYTIRMVNGKVNAIEFAEVSPTDRPKRFGDLSSFLREHKQLMSTSVASVEPAGVAQDGAFKTASYRMLGEHKQDLGHVDFKLDGTGGLLSMHVSSRDAAHDSGRESVVK